MSDVRFVTAWRRNNPQHEADVRAYWARVPVVPARVMDRRVKELCILAYSGDRVVAEASAELVMLPGLRARFAMGRVSVDADHRRGTLGARIGGHMRRILEAWSLENPEEDVKGFGGVITAAEFGEKQSQPVWHDWGVDIAVAGYTPSGEQIRVGWFAHARI